MPRNRAKNVYITIGLPLDSPLLHQMKEESRRTGTSLAKLIPVKLNELYRGSPEEQREIAPVVSEPEEEDVEANALAFLGEGN